MAMAKAEDYEYCYVVTKLLDDALKYYPGMGKYKEAIPYMKKYFSKVEMATCEDYYSLGYCYYHEKIRSDTTKIYNSENCGLEYKRYDNKYEIRYKTSDIHISLISTSIFKFKYYKHFIHVLKINCRRYCSGLGKII